MTLEDFKLIKDFHLNTIKEAQTALIEALIDYIKGDLATQIREEIPEAKTITWCQYTPSWNDGDYCYPTVSTSYMVGTTDGNTVNAGWNVSDLIEDAISCVGTECLFAHFGENLQITMDLDTGNHTQEDYDG